jgi:Transposase
MESTSTDWKPAFYCLEEVMEVWLLNAAHMKGKTDVRDAEWIAQLLEHGLLSPSFVPPPPIRHLRMLTRYREQLMGEPDPRDGAAGADAGGREHQAVRAPTTFGEERVPLEGAPECDVGDHRCPGHLYSTRARPGVGDRATHGLDPRKQGAESLGGDGLGVPGHDARPIRYTVPP